MKSSQPAEMSSDATEYFEFLRAYVREGDWDLAIETLSDYLSDGRIPITKAEYDELIDLLSIRGDEYVSKLQLSNYVVI